MLHTKFDILQREPMDVRTLIKIQKFEVDRYKEGKVSFDLVDVKKNELIWQGLSQAHL